MHNIYFIKFFKIIKKLWPFKLQNKKKYFIKKNHCLNLKSGSEAQWIKFILLDFK